MAFSTCTKNYLEHFSTRTKNHLAQD